MRTTTNDLNTTFRLIFDRSNSAPLLLVHQQHRLDGAPRSVILDGAIDSGDGVAAPAGTCVSTGAARISIVPPPLVIYPVTLIFRLCRGPGNPPPAESKYPMQYPAPTVLITGANRGMGLEFARQYAEAGWEVHATARNPDTAAALNTLANSHAQLHVHALDVSSSDSVATLAAALGDQPLDILLSNASHMTHLRDQSFDTANPDLFAQSFDVNAIGPFRLAQTLIDNVRASREKKMMFMGSTAGSTGSILPPVKLFAYCPAKAALHSIVRGLHLNLAPEGITVGLLEPGVVDTQGFANVAEGEPAPYGMDAVVELLREGVLEMATPASAVTALRGIIETMTPQSGGQLTRFDGAIIPW